MQLSFGACLFDSDRRVLERAGAPVHLSPRAFAVLELLITERPRAISKQTLLDRVWHDVVVEEQNVKNAIVEIRAALGADESAIETVQRFGYAFAVEAAGSESTARLVTKDQSHVLRNGQNVIGRDPACTVSIVATGVSRRHARITIRGDSATLEDLGSKNGTWRNEEHVDLAVELRDGDTIRIGVVKMTFRVGALPSTATLG